MASKSRSHIEATEPLIPFNIPALATTIQTVLYLKINKLMHPDNPVFKVNKLKHPDGPVIKRSSLMHPDGPVLEKNKLKHSDGPALQRNKLKHPVFKINKLTHQEEVLF